MLRGLYELKQRYSDHHGVSYSDVALVAIVDAAEEGDEAGFWQRSLDLLDEVSSRVGMLEARDMVTVEDVDEVATALV